MSPPLLRPACLVALLVWPALAPAQPIDARHDLETAKIFHGEEDGTLTHEEAARLRARQDDIHRLEEQMRAANWRKLTNRDRTILRQREDALDAQIEAARHNSVTQHGKP